MQDNLLSFVSGIDPDYISPPEIEPGSIWDKLLKVITAQVKIDGVRKSSILPGQSAASITENASENIYYDVAEFYDWYFEVEDERNQFMASQKKATILSPLRAAVKPIVEHNIADMEDADLIPIEVDPDDIVETVTENLTRYILNWEDWYYDRKAQEEFEDSMIDKAIYEEIYINSDYGDLTNRTNYLDEENEDIED